MWRSLANAKRHCKDVGGDTAGSRALSQRRNRTVTRDALKAVEELPGGEQEAAVKGLCEKLEEAKALVFAWANDHGEP